MKAVVHRWTEAQTASAVTMREHADGRMVEVLCLVAPRKGGPFVVDRVGSVGCAGMNINLQTWLPYRRNWRLP